jgi:hypothetical protein
VQLPPRVDQSFFHKLNAQHEDESSNDHDGNKSNNHGTNDKNTDRSKGKHDTCQSRIAAAGDEKKTISVYKVVLELHEYMKRTMSLELLNHTCMLPAKPESALVMP